MRVYAFKAGGLESDSLILACKTETQQNKHTMKRDGGCLACLMNNKLERPFISTVELTVFHLMWVRHAAERLL